MRGGGWAVPKILPERGDNPEKGDSGGAGGGGVDGEMGRCHFFITLQFNFIYCVQLQFGSSFFCVNHILIQVFIVLKHCIICIFLTHSDSLQRMLTALFKLVLNIQKSTCTNFLSIKARCFLILKMFWCLNELPCCFLM